MTIPLAQLETWSGQGSVTQSKNTYATVKAALEDANSKYTDRNFKVFLQDHTVMTQIFTPKATWT